MFDFIGSPWVGAIVAIAALLLLVLLLLRYRALERAGTPLPPGAGGARMVGTTGTVVVDHVPGEQRGQVHVLGEDWSIADAVDRRLPVGTTVRVERVTGTRLVVAPTTDAGDGSEPDSHPDTNHDVRT